MQTKIQKMLFNINLKEKNQFINTSKSTRICIDPSAKITNVLIYLKILRNKNRFNLFDV